MTRARDNADLGDSYGVLGAGVTGGSGLTHLASDPTVTLGSNATFPEIMTNGGGSIKWRHTYYNSHFSIATNQYWANYDIGPTSILDANDERSIFIYLNLKNRWTGNYRMNGPCALYHSGGIALHQAEMTTGYLLLTVVTSGSNYHLRFQNTYSPANVTTPLSGHIFQSTNVDFTG